MGSHHTPVQYSIFFPGELPNWKYSRSFYNLKWAYAFSIYIRELIFSKGKFSLEPLVQNFLPTQIRNLVHTACVMMQIKLD